MLKGFVNGVEKMLEYISCKKCGIIYQREVKFHNNKYKSCDICYYMNYSNWPAREIIELLSHVEKLNPQDIHYEIIASIFISSAFEFLLDDLLSIAALYDRYYDEVDYLFELLMDSYQGKKRKLILYSHFGDNSFEKEVKETGNNNFMDHWDQITEIRNSRIHGDFYQKHRLTKEQVMKVITEGLDVFYKLSNKYKRRAHEYKHQYDFARDESDFVNTIGGLNLEKKEKLPTKKDLQKLNRWRQVILSSGFKLYDPPKNK